MSTAKFDTLSNLAGTYTVPVATAAQGSAKAWVNFNGTGTVAIRASFNVSSITDNGTGDYTVNFTTALPDTNYAVTVGSYNTAAGDGGWICVFGGVGGTYPANVTTTTVRIASYSSGGTAQDNQAMMIAISR